MFDVVRLLIKENNAKLQKCVQYVGGSLTVWKLCAKPMGCMGIVFLFDNMIVKERR